MLEYDRVPKGIDVNKTNGSCESIICCYWYFLIKNFRFLSKVHACSHNLRQKGMIFNDVVTLSVKGSLL